MTSKTMTAPAATDRRTILLLSGCQALALSGSALVMTVAALAGQMLAPEPWMATLPLALQFLATMLSTIPASLLMGRLGRRFGFILGQIVGIASAGLAVLGLMEGSFWLFAAGSLGVGMHNAVWQYFRFAAAEVADESYRPRAISYVLAGGVVAAVLGPELAKWSREALAPVTFAGSYAVIAGLALVSIVLLAFIRIPPPVRSERRASGRPLAEIARQPTFRIAVLAAMIGYGVMTLVMVATPLAMVACGFAFDDAAFVIQWHVLAMFLPSFFTGTVIKRLGVLPVILTGALLYAGCMVLNLMGQDIQNFWLALVLLGLGWNFMFIGGTTLLTDTYRPEERSKVQALNDFAVFTVVAAASFSSGALQDALGWEAVNAAMSLPVLIAFAAVVWLMMQQRRAVA